MSGSKSHIEYLEEQCTPKTPRTEQDILKDFEKLGYKVVQNSNAICVLKYNDFEIDIRKYGRKYCASDWDYLDMQEHKLLNELFKCWGWI